MKYSRKYPYPIMGNRNILPPPPPLPLEIPNGSTAPLPSCNSKIINNPFSPLEFPSLNFHRTENLHFFPFQENSTHNFWSSKWATQLC